jgi:hypothetical protein
MTTREEQLKRWRREKKLHLICTIILEFKDFAQTWRWKTITVHEKDVSVTTQCVLPGNPVLGFGGRKGLNSVGRIGTATEITT